MYKTIEVDGKTVYQQFDYPETIDGLDKQTIVNTLNYDEFIANMSDDWNRTKSELNTIQEYRQKHNL